MDQQRRANRAQPASRRGATSNSQRRGQDAQANTETSSERSGANSNSARSATVHGIGNGETHPDDDIVERDANGEIILNRPQLIPPQPGDPDYNLPTEDPVLARQNEVIALYTKHGNNLPEPIMEEVRAALRASLNRAVDSLEDDRWMYEPENDPRPRV